MVAQGAVTWPTSPHGSAFTLTCNSARLHSDARQLTSPRFPTQQPLLRWQQRPSQPSSRLPPFYPRPGASSSTGFITMDLVPEASLLKLPTPPYPRDEIHVVVIRLSNDNRELCLQSHAVGRGALYSTPIHVIVASIGILIGDPNRVREGVLVRHHTSTPIPSCKQTKICRFLVKLQRAHMNTLSPRTLQVSIQPL